MKVYFSNYISLKTNTIMRIQLTTHLTLSAARCQQNHDNGGGKRTLISQRSFSNLRGLATHKTHVAKINAFTTYWILKTTTYESMTNHRISMLTYKTSIQISVSGLNELYRHY